MSQFSIQEKNQLLGAWAHGWTISRCTDAPIPLADSAYRIQVDLPGHLERYILPGNIPGTIQKLAREIDTPDTWLKICAPHSSIVGLLPERWHIKPPEYLMSKILSHTTVNMPETYSIALTVDGHAVTARVCNQEGKHAATGRMAIHGTHAVFDQIVTEPAHRRRGLANAIMQSLSNHAVSKQAEQGVLVATDEGRALYTTLGWLLASEMTAAVMV
ncbi:GNAT family N-acetyltransferase [Undibacterium pigrum]|uniref:Acetyltransferase (GNAT) family protein n=1 Tax=Undibacterium pigrum TaxID=401470 RepID=A0A318J417_9BURK|nr:GNAT family N-acetyltransferase [Undibacterium pigrum]PXX41431.1 acetyltransferase (GNAT) family protein [Undibacterium pigrum]